jgi:DNA-binding GntR family transcriptional regulator
VREHEAILAALSARDVKRIKVLLSDHLAHKLSSVLAELKALSMKAPELKALSTRQAA